MIVTAELSMYPLKNDYEEYIVSFIKDLRTKSGVQVYTTAMSTYVKGEYTSVMEALNSSMLKAFELNNYVSIVIKMIPKDLPVEGGFLEL